MEPHTELTGAVKALGSDHAFAERAMERLLLGTLPAGMDDVASPNDRHAIGQFRDIFDNCRLSAAFQPILDFRARNYLAYEGLIRGPIDTAMHSPIALFDAARKAGMNTEFERLCREVVLREFAALRLPGKLFINVSINCLADPHFMNGHTASLLREIGLRPQQIVIELTENQHVSDFSALRDVLSAYRKLGYQIAVDDLGEGFSNLRMWSEVRPEFVKIDRHFISGIADDALKFSLVRAMHDIAEASDCRVIAEGIETEAEFATVRDLGIAFGQGFLIARPNANPDFACNQDVQEMISRSQVIVFPHARAGKMSATTAGDMMSDILPVTPDADNEAIFTRFEEDASLVVVPVVDKSGKPLGLINRHSLLDRYARPFRRELYGRKPCTLLMDPHPLIVDHDLSVQEVGLLLGQSPQHHMFDGFVVTDGGSYIGIGKTQVLMALITDMQITAARYANPLTQLPGNVPINEHIDRLIGKRSDFVACYCDLDQFKPFNDHYGYRQGDQMIQLLGSILSRIGDPHLDFVGHIGGDDFMLLLQSEDWQQKLDDILEHFASGIEAMTEKQHRQQGGYWGEDRRGNAIFHPLPTLSIGCLMVGAGDFHSHYEVSAAVVAAKKQAKKINGNSLFVERRRMSV